MSLEDEILNDIQKTGFVTELKAVSLFIEKGWSTEHSTTYEDKDENRSREIDIVATKVEYIRELGFRLIINLVCEVKKSERPWIIFTTRRTLGSLGWRIMHNLVNTFIIKESKTSKTGKSRHSILDFDSIDKKNIREHENRVGKAFHELKKNPGEKSKIYEALITSSKASKYFNDLYEEKNDEKEFVPDGMSELEFFLPTVILDGKLFEVYNQTNGDMKVHSKQYIPVEMKYSSPNYRKGNWDVDFFPDVITFDYLSDHLNQIEIWRQSMITLISDSLKKHGKLPDKW